MVCLIKFIAPCSLWCRLFWYKWSYRHVLQAPYFGANELSFLVHVYRIWCKWAFSRFPLHLYMGSKIIFLGNDRWLFASQKVQYSTTNTNTFISTLLLLCTLCLNWYFMYYCDMDDSYILLLFVYSIMKYLRVKYCWMWDLQLLLSANVPIP